MRTSLPLAKWASFQGDSKSQENAYICVEAHGFSRGFNSEKMKTALAAVVHRHGPQKRASVRAMEMGWERTFFVTAVAWQQRCIFSNDTLPRMLIETLYLYRTEKRFALHAFVVMPEHMHLLITPAEIVSIEKAMQLIKGGFSFRVRKERPNLLIWEKSFTNHRIRDAEDFERHREYIHQNPVRKGLVHAAGEYAYSSAHPGFELDPPPVATAAKAGSF